MACVVMVRVRRTRPSQGEGGGRLFRLVRPVSYIFVSRFSAEQVPPLRLALGGD